jgi:hypothetical protein
MDAYKLGWLYQVACNRINDACAELYESFHDEEGQPLTDLEQINVNIRLFQRQVSLEVDLVRQALTEYTDSKGD